MERVIPCILPILRKSPPGLNPGHNGKGDSKKKCGFNALKKRLNPGHNGKGDSMRQSTQTERSVLVLILVIMERVIPKNMAIMI